MEDHEINPIGIMIDEIENKNYSTASNIFTDLLSNKLNDALEAKKIAIASKMFNDDKEDLDDLEEYLENEEI